MSSASPDILHGHLWVPGRLPSLEDLVAAAKSGHGKRNGYARLKKQETERVMWLARAAGLKLVTGPVRIHFCWKVTPDMRTDPDNLAAGGRKILLDALLVPRPATAKSSGRIGAGVLPDDSLKWVRGFKDEFESDAKDAGVHVFLFRADG